MKDTGSVLLTGHRLGWNTRGDLVWRERVHDEDANEWGEVYRYDEMGRLTDCWTNVQTPSSYTTTDPTTGGSVYDDHVDYTIGKVYERTQKSVTPDGGSATEIDYTVNDGYRWGDLEHLHEDLRQSWQAGHGDGPGRCGLDLHLR